MRKKVPRVGVIIPLPSWLLSSQLSCAERSNWCEHHSGNFPPLRSALVLAQTLLGNAFVHCELSNMSIIFEDNSPVHNTEFQNKIKQNSNQPISTGKKKRLHREHKHLEFFVYRL